MPSSFLQPQWGRLPCLHPHPSLHQGCQGCTVVRRGPDENSTEVLGHHHLLGPWEAGSLGSSFLVSGSWPLPKRLGAPRVWGYQVGA